MEQVIKLFFLILFIIFARQIITIILKVIIMPFQSDKKKSYNSIKAFSDSYFDDSKKNENNIEYKYIKDNLVCNKFKNERIEVNYSITEVNQLSANEHIYVEYFVTDNRSWRQLCGREGYVFKCRKHNIQVHEIIICMN